ncbi:MAG: acetylxylan esterase, partial [Candidatus Hydrogenedentes bacterium]|nr:acetylxylan esterase [Candidatus Hydrogenedentota bacterium]
MAMWLRVVTCVNLLAGMLILPEALAGPEAAREAVGTAVGKQLVGPKAVQEELAAFVRAHTPALTAPADAAAWDTGQARLRAEFLEKVVFRGVPASWREGEVKIEWGDTLDRGKGYVIKKLRYEALPGLWIPALLYVPSELPEKAVAVLNVNGHVGEGKAVAYEQIRCINLAKRGIINLHPEWLRMGELQGDEYNHNLLAYLDLVGTSGVSVFYLAMSRGLDVLLQQPHVDPERVVMTGLSGGGWQTIFLSALDTRIKACAPNAGYIGIDVRTQYPGDIGDLEQVPTDFMSVANFTHLTAMLAPRPALLIYNAKDECCFEAGHAVPAVYDPIVPFYKLYQAEDRFTYHINENPGTHNYDQDNREAFYRFLKQHIAPEATWPVTELPTDGELFTLEELSMGVPEGNATLVSLARQIYATRPKPIVPSRTRKQVDKLKQVIAFDEPTYEATLVEEKTAANLIIASYLLRLEEGFSFPLVSVQQPETKPAALVVFVSDDGMAGLTDDLLAVAKAGDRAVAIDPVFLGQTKPEGNLWQWPMMINTTGERALGIQVEQLIAALDWARTDHPAETTIRTYGWNSTVAGLLAAVVKPPITQFETVNAPESLAQVLDEKVDYNKIPALFTFGLVPEFDLPVLRDMLWST